MDGKAGAGVSFSSPGGWPRRGCAKGRQIQMGRSRLFTLFLLQNQKQLTQFPSTCHRYLQVGSHFTSRGGDKWVSVCLNSPAVGLGLPPRVRDSTCWGTPNSPSQLPLLSLPAFFFLTPLREAITAFLCFHVFQLWRFRERAIFLPY